MKQTYSAVVLTILAKYFLLYLFLMGKNHNYYFIAPGIRDGVDLFLYLWLLLALPTTEVVCFSGLLYWALRAQNRGVATAVTLGGVGLGAGLYHCLASPGDPTTAVILGLIGVVLQGLLLIKKTRLQRG